MNQLPLRTIVCLISLSLFSLSSNQTSIAQQWQLGHQPSQYSVRQYNPAGGGSYPLLQEPESQAPRPHAPVDSMPTLETAPISVADPKLSYPLKENGSEAMTQLAQPPTPNALSPQVPIAGENRLGAPVYNPFSVAPPQPTSLVPPQSPSTDKPETQAAGTPGRFALDYPIYRDRNTYPIDPRKPCNECTRPHINEACKCQWPGKQGRPYQDREPGTCSCSSASNKNRPNFSYNWPAPFSAITATHGAACSCCDSPRKHLNDRFDHLADFKLIDYKRTDNGYCGNGSDPYGCFGESRVAGVGFRQPGESASQRR